MRGFQPVQCHGGLAAHQVQTRHAQGIAVVLDQPLTALVGLDGHCAACRVCTHPFDADRAAARAHVPKQLPRLRGQPAQGDGAHIALGQLAVMPVGVIGQACQTVQARRFGRCHALDGHQVERGRLPVLPRGCMPVQLALSLATQVFEDPQAAGAETPFA